MLNLRQYRKNPDRLSDLLPWAALVADGVVLNKDGSFQATMSFRGPDLDCATAGELAAVSARLNNALKRLGAGWALYIEAQRKRQPGYPQSRFPDPVSALIDAEREALFKEQLNFESSYYLTLIYLPPKDLENRVAATFLSQAKGEKSYHSELNSFLEELTRVSALLEGVLAKVKRLNSAETLTYLHSLISDRPHPVKVPPIPMYLDAFLADTALCGGLSPKLGAKFLKCLAVLSFPGFSEPGLLDRLNRLALEYRWVTRFIALDKAEAEKELSSYKRKWFAKRKSVLTLLKETFTGSESIMEDSDAVKSAACADEALGELRSDAVSYGYFTATLVLAGDDAENLNKAALEITRVINSLGFVSRGEDVNALDAWLGSLPGNCRNNVRRPLLNTLNLAHLMPLSSVWGGERRDFHLKAPCLFYGFTSGSTQFRYALHVGDVGHTLVLGPTGAGKSVLLNLMAAQMLRYPGAQVYIFDRGKSARTLTHALGGEYFLLGKEDLSFQPLAKINELSDRRFICEWLLDIVQKENVDINPRRKEHLWLALGSLAQAPLKERTMYGLTVLIQDEALRKALRPYTQEGPYGALFDNDRDELTLGSFLCFETEELLESRHVAATALRYLFYRLEERFTGAPTLLILDEAWAYLDNQSFQAKIREWLKVLRKANVAVVFATQSLTDIAESPISAALKEACLSKIFLPNAAAGNAAEAAVYSSFGLNEREISLISQATPKKDYYYSSALGKRLFSLGLGPIALAYLSGAGKERDKLLTKLLAENSSRDDFNRSFLANLGLYQEPNLKEAA